MIPTQQIARKSRTRASDAPRAVRHGQWLLFLIALVLVAAGSLYAALSTVVRVDTILLAGSELRLPGRLARLPGLDIAPAPAGALTDRINILVMGVDRRPHHNPEWDGPPRTDSIMIVSLDPQTKSGSVVAIPRDLYLEVPDPKGGTGIWDTRVNTAYHYGALYKYPGGGAALARATVEHNFKIPIDYHAVIDWTAFADIIDALNGIEIIVPETLRGVEAYGVRDGNSFPITIAAGRQRMDSITALAYSRFRDDADGDFGRVRRQQQVMQAALEKGLALGWLGRTPSLYARFRGAVESDIGLARLPGLTALVKLVGPERLVMSSVAGRNGENVTRRITPQGEDVLVPVWESMGRALAEAIPDERLESEHATVKLVNAAGWRDFATLTARALAGYGVPPAYLQPTDNERVDRRIKTTLTVYGDKDYSAQRIAMLLGVPGAQIQHKDELLREAGEADIVVMLGQDVRLPDSSRYDHFSTR